MKSGQKSQHIDMVEKRLGFTVCQHINMFSRIPTVNGTYFDETRASQKKFGNPSYHMGEDIATRWVRPPPTT